MQPHSDAWGCTQEWASNNCLGEFHSTLWKESVQTLNCCLEAGCGRGALMLEPRTMR